MIASFSVKFVPKELAQQPYVVVCSLCPTIPKLFISYSNIEIYK